MPFYLWNLNRLFHLTDGYFWFELINLLFLMTSTFVLPSILFYFIYGDKLIIHRKRYSYLVKYYKPQYKWTTIMQLLIKDITACFITFYYYFQMGNNYSIIGISLLYLILNAIIRPYNNKFMNIMNIIFPFIAFVISVISQVEFYCNSHIIFLIVKALFVFLYMIITVIFICKICKRSKSISLLEDVGLELNELS